MEGVPHLCGDRAARLTTQQGNQLICPGPVLLLGQVCYGHPGGVPQLLPRVLLQGTSVNHLLNTQQCSSLLCAASRCPWRALPVSGTSGAGNSLAILHCASDKAACLSYSGLSSGDSNHVSTHSSPTDRYSSRCLPIQRTVTFTPLMQEAGIVPDQAAGAACPCTAPEEQPQGVLPG